ncbi:hypothetical protein [Paenibacillus sp. CR_12]|uniref:capsular polysaccharide export protein, LipB/KpsS family n=1 Tax=Paenibacillus sp. CR_12 TaxID=3055793 RepID=UPI0035BFF152
MVNINVFISSMGNIEFGIPVLLKRLTEELNHRQCRCFYFSIPNGKGIDGDEELYRALNINAERVNIISNDYIEFSEYRNYSSSELEDMIKSNVGSSANKEISLNQAKEYLERIHRADAEYGIDMFIVWGIRIRERTIYHYARKHDIPIFIFEHGYFRPFTLTVDSKGINYENSLPRTREFYMNIDFDQHRFNEFIESPEVAWKDEEITKEFRLICDATAQKEEKTNKKRIINRINHTVRHKRVKQALMKRAIILKAHVRKLRAQTKMDNYNDITKKMIESGERFIFVPFQLESDTQTMLFSPNIKTMLKLVRVLSESLNSYNTEYKDNLKIIFKTHPMYKLKEPNLDLFNILRVCSQNNNLAITSSIATNELIAKSECVITINSTVGIEALSANKKVITLGNAFYNIEGIAHHVNNIKDLVKDLNTVLNSTFEKDLVQRFLYYIRFNYFSEIYYLNPDQDSVKRLVDRILNGNKGE